MRKVSTICFKTETNGAIPPRPGSVSADSRTQNSLLVGKHPMFRWFLMLLSWSDRTPPSQTSHVSMNSPEGGFFLGTKWKSDPMSRYVICCWSVLHIPSLIRWTTFEQNFNTEYTCDVCFTVFLSKQHIHSVGLTHYIIQSLNPNLRPKSFATQ